MTPAALELQDQNLRAEADALLARHQLLHILRRFGTPHVSGSYALRLMTWRDLDIYLEMRPPDRKTFLELGRQLGEALTPRKLSFTDHLDFPSTEAVRGLYWGVRTDEASRGGWKIDIWGVEPSVCADRVSACESLAARIDAAARVAILTIKNEICRRPGYRDRITSQDVYDAVLVGGATTVEEFRAFLNAAGRDV